MKTVWISALEHNPSRVSAITEVLKRYGLSSRGHFWEDAPDKQVWRAALAEMLEMRADLWLILADQTELAKPSVRCGLALLAIALQNARGAAFPIILLYQGTSSDAETLPFPLRASTLIEETAPSWPAKIVAKANMGNLAPTPDYRLDILGDERLGLWFEIGPRSGIWEGVIFGVAGAKISFQAVGQKGLLPSTSELAFAQQGMQMNAGDRRFDAWAVRNTLDQNTSYFAQVSAHPEAILFFPYTEASDANAIVIPLS